MLSSTSKLGLTVILKVPIYLANDCIQVLKVTSNVQLVLTVHNWKQLQSTCIKFNNKTLLQIYSLQTSSEMCCHTPYSNIHPYCVHKHTHTYVCMQHIHLHAGLQKYVYCITYMHVCPPPHFHSGPPHNNLTPWHTCLLSTLPIPIAKMRAPLLRAKLACRER